MVEKTDKDKRIRKETNRLNRIFEEFPQTQKDIANGLVEEVAFMRITLEDLKVEININGIIDVMPQGDYSITRESPAVKTYNTMVQRYNTVCKELFNLIPKQEFVDYDDEFERF